MKILIGIFGVKLEMKFLAAIFETRSALEILEKSVRDWFLIKFVKLLEDWFRQGDSLGILEN